MKIHRRIGQSGFLVLGILGAMNGQDPPASELISVDVHRVVLYATVREGKARIVGDLKREDFTVLENGARQQILSFGRDDVPVAIGILVDNSGSMMNKRNEVVGAAKTFVSASNPNDEIFVLHFNESLNFGLPAETAFTGDQTRLGIALDRMNLDGRTALYDAIHVGLEHLEKSTLTKKALIVISDGGDNFSQRKEADVIREADLSGSLFYAIGIYDPMDGDANPGVLRKLAQNTGGEVFFPKDLRDVNALCASIARDLRSQYTLSYAPRAAKAGPLAPKEYRRVQVSVKNPPGRKLVVRTRTGYFAGPAKPTPGNKQ